jgi:CubicO group peptidase (beta-lactamase class C family)
MRVLRVLLLGLLALRATPASAQNVARMEEVIQSHVGASTFMGSVLVARDREIVLSRGYGFANLEWQIPNSPTTKFRLGSLTKQFTSASILLLAERHKLSLDDRIKQYVPDAPSAWDAITIFHLLTHTSGLFNYTALPDFTSTMPLPLTPAQIIGKVRDRPLEFEPGSKMSYSNTGYIVLGMIIEKVSGEPYAAFLQKNLFELPDLNLMVTLEGDRLMAQLSGQSRFRLFPESPTRFFVKVIDAQIDFATDGSGSVTGAVLHQNGRDMKAVRKSDRVLERQAVALPRGVLERYVGSYQMRPGTDMTVTLDDDHLSVQITGQPKFEMFAERENFFFLKIVDAQIEFITDSAGAVTTATLHQGPVNIAAPRK